MHIIILTPTSDGKLETFYCSSLVNTILLCKEKGIDVSFMTHDYEPALPHSRNVLFKRAIYQKPDAIVWIDSDISWDPNDFLKLIYSQHDVVGGTYRKKQNQEEYVASFNELDEGTVSEVKSLGLGFLKMSNKAINLIWSLSKKYHADYEGFRNVFEMEIKNGQIYTEDTLLSDKLRNLGIKTYLDKTITCAHIGKTHYIGDFNEWSKNI